jgi:hypothetical protein
LKKDDNTWLVLGSLVSEGKITMNCESHGVGGGGGIEKNFSIWGDLCSSFQNTRRELSEEIKNRYDELELLEQEALSLERLAMSCASCDLRDRSVEQAFSIYEQVDSQIHELSRLEQVRSDADYAFALSMEAHEIPNSMETPKLSTEDARWMFPRRFVSFRPEFCESVFHIKNRFVHFLPQDEEGRVRDKHYRRKRNRRNRKHRRSSHTE